MVDIGQDSDASKSRLPHWTVPAALGLMIAAIAAYSAPFFTARLTHSIREVYTYNLDTTVILHSVRDALHDRYFRFNFTDYGHLYFNLAIAQCFLYSLFAPPSEGSIYFILRLTSFAGGALTVLTVFAFARHFLGRELGLIQRRYHCAVACFGDVLFRASSGFLAGFVHHSFALRSCPRRAPKWRRAGFALVRGSGWAAGAAFSSKYVGMLLLPLLVGLALIMPLGTIRDEVFRWIIKALALTGAFTAVALLYLAYVLNHDHTLAVCHNGANCRPSPTAPVSSCCVRCSLRPRWSGWPWRWLMARGWIFYNGAGRSSVSW